MVFLCPVTVKKKRPLPVHLDHWQKIRKVIALATATAACAVVGVAGAVFEKQPMHTSVLTGYGRVEELLEGHPERCRRAFGMSRHVFLKLIQALRTHCGLHPTRHLSTLEQVAIFLRTAVTGMGNREHQERFQRSGETISKCFHRILNMLVDPEFYGRYVRLPPPNEIPPEIRNNPHYYPFFEDCLGAVDGSLLDGFVSAADMGRYRSRKGRISQNIFAACRFNMLFCYLLTGWEGSAADGRVFADACRNGFAIPPGKYYLGDAGFPACDALLVPYRGVQYHLQEWRRSGNLRPANYKELFNLRHARLRNVIERIFGVSKRRFRLMNIAPEYSLETQAKIPCALSGLHNFIRIHDPDDFADEANERGPRNPTFTLREVDGDERCVFREEELGRYISLQEKTRAEAARDRIAKDMWEKYIEDDE